MPIPPIPVHPAAMRELNDTLNSLSLLPLEETGLIERTSVGALGNPSTFAVRPIGAGFSSNIATIADAGGNGSSYIRTNVAYTLQNVGTAQQLFNDPTNGRLTLDVGTYLFEALISLSSMSASNGNAQFLISSGGTATVTAVLYLSLGVDSTANGAGAGGSSMSTNVGSPASAVPAGTGTGLQLLVRGTFEVTVAGTIIPSITLVTAAAAVVAVGSFFKCDRIGSTTATSVGLWD